MAESTATSEILISIPQQVPVSKPAPPAQKVPAAGAFYRRPLPDNCIAFASEEGKKVFTEALMSGHMNCYFKLASQFRTQDEPAYCGLSTLIMVLNSMEIDPGRVWKGPWKWYHEDMLDCCIPTEMIRKKGITFEEFACLAECNSLDCHAMRVDKSSREEDFRSLVQSITQKDDKVLVASYSRFVMGQTGDGHFSTIAGYHPDKDLVLILDVARFKYPPHWASLSLLFQAMKAWDKVTGLPRGYMTLWPAKNSKILLLFKAAKWFSVNVCQENLKTYKSFSSAWMELMASASHNDGGLSSVLSQVLQGLVKIARTFDKMVVLTTQEHVTCTNTCNLQCVIKKLLSQLEATTMFQIVCKETSEMSVEDVSLLEKLFGSWPTVCSSVRDTLQEVKAESRKMSCDMNMCLCLSHLITAFLLSWPYSSTPAAHTVECSLQVFSKEVQSESHGQLLKDEMSTLSRQLEKLTNFHTVSVPPCEAPRCECKKQT